MGSKGCTSHDLCLEQHRTRGIVSLISFLVRIFVIGRDVLFFHKYLAYPKRHQFNNITLLLGIEGHVGRVECLSPFDFRSRDSKAPLRIILLGQIHLWYLARAWNHILQQVMDEGNQMTTYKSKA